MSDNKGLSAFINKNKKGKKTAKATQDSAAKEEAKQNDVKAKNEDVKKNTPV